MKHLFLCGTLLLLLAPFSALGQNIEPSVFTATISGPSDAPVGRPILFNALVSGIVTEGETTTFEWKLLNNDQVISETIDAIFTPEDPGPKTIVLTIETTIDEQLFTQTREHTVSAYNRKMVFIADEQADQEKLDRHRLGAQQAGTYIPPTITVETSNVGADNALVKLAQDQPETLQNAETIVFWSDDISGMQALMQAAENNEELRQHIKDSTLLLVTDSNLTSLARVARSPFRVLRPEQIILTRKQAVTSLFTTENVDGFLTDITTQDIAFTKVDSDMSAVRPWNFLSLLVSYMLTNGIASQTIILLLSLPLIATILAFLKQFVGITTLGLFTPSIIALSFLALGWKVGLLFLLFVLFTGYITRESMKGLAILYIPKVAIMLTAISISLLLLFGIGSWLKVSLPSDTIFILLIMSTLTESVMSLKSERGWFGAIIGMGETILAALICVFIVQLPNLQSLLLAYPELILLTIIFNIIVGRYTGLRIMEYFRFREVFKNLREE